MKKTMLSLLALITLPNISYGQNFMKQFEELFSKKDTVGQIQLLNNWEKQIVMIRNFMWLITTIM